MTEKPAETIQTLLEAEQEAKTAVEQARKERDIRLKQAATEADAEIAEYRKSKDADYQLQLAKVAGSTGEASQRIMAESKVHIKSITAAAKTHKKEVVDMLVHYVKNVNTST